MDISADRSTADTNRPDPFSAVMQTVRGFIWRLIGFLMLSEEDKRKAGIYLGGQGRNR
jgi:hypothetical protein